MAERNTKLKTYQLHRKIYATTATLGRVYSPEGDLLCSSLENPWLANINNYSCIPEGVYVVERDRTGRHQYYRLNYSERPNTEIHVGNFEKDTQGCILFGSDWAFMTPKNCMEEELSTTSSGPTINCTEEELSITSSGPTMDFLLGVLPEKFKLEIIRRDYKNLGNV